MKSPSGTFILILLSVIIVSINYLVGIRSYDVRISSAHHETETQKRFVCCHTRDEKDEFEMKSLPNGCTRIYLPSIVVPWKSASPLHAGGKSLVLYRGRNPESFVLLSTRKLPVPRSREPKNWWEILPALTPWNSSVSLGYLDAIDESTLSCPHHPSGFEDARGILVGEDLIAVTNSFHPRTCRRAMSLIVVNYLMALNILESVNRDGRIVPQSVVHLVPPGGHSRKIEKNCDYFSFSFPSKL